MTVILLRFCTIPEGHFICKLVIVVLAPNPKCAVKLFSEPNPVLDAISRTCVFPPAVNLIRVPIAERFEVVPFNLIS